MSIAAAGAGLAVAGAYLDAKYHITKDLSTLWHLRAIEKNTQRRIANGTLSPYYWLEENAKTLPPQHEAIWSRDAVYTYRDMLASVNRYAQFLLGQGARPGECIALCLTNNPEILILVFACWAIGCYPSLLNHNNGGEAIMHALGLSQTRIMIVDDDPEARQRVDDMRERITQGTKQQIIILDRRIKSEVDAIESQRPGDELRECMKINTPSMLIFTSGTTGFPKACPFELSRLCRSNSGRFRTFGLPYGIDSRWYVCMPLYHGTGICGSLSCLAAGATVCIGKRFRNRTFWPDCRDSRATGFIYVGEVARYLVAQPPSPLDRQHNVKVVFGNGMRPDVWRAFRDRFGIDLITEFFSSTEGVLTLLNQSRGDFFATSVGHHGALLRWITRNSHKAALTDPDNSKELLRNAEGRCIASPLSEGGEILVAVPGRKTLESGFMGYKSNQKATDERFATDVFREGDLFYRSGDALRRDDDGRWYFLDRLGDTFRWKSENVSTAEVAVEVGKFPGVQEANVYGVLVPGHDGRAGCAALYIEGGIGGVDKFDWPGLAKHSRAALPKYAVPVFIRVHAGEIQGTHNHKQNKVPLREQGIDVEKIPQEERMLWLLPDADRYIEFTKRDLDRLNSNQARL